jgi:hypothetical protein
MKNMYIERSWRVVTWMDWFFVERSGSGLVDMVEK